MGSINSDTTVPEISSDNIWEYTHVVYWVEVSTTGKISNGLPKQTSIYTQQNF